MKKSRCTKCNLNFYGDICTNCNKVILPISSKEKSDAPTPQPFVSSNVLENKWIASTSDGKTFFEDIIPGAKSAWMRLKDYCKEKNIKITNLRMQVDGQTFYLPAKAKGYTSLGFKSVDSQGREEDKKGIGYVTENDTILMLWKTIGKGDIRIEEREFKEGPCILNAL